MLMPQKHVNLSESLIGLGASILMVVGNTTKTLDNIISEVNVLIESNNIKRVYNNTDNILLAIDYLFSIGVIDINEEGGIYNVLNRA